MSPAAHSEAQRQQMLQLVKRSIEHGLERGTPASVPHPLPPYLQQPGACFVTLEINHQLRGCIGSLEAYRPLAEDLLENGFAAAFRDPRFPPLSAPELAQLSLKISLLTLPQPMQFESEAELIRQLLPGVDGLILREGRQRGTFLPSVWEQLPDPHDFLNQLKRKAGLPPHHWSNQIEIERYRTEQF